MLQQLGWWLRSPSNVSLSSVTHWNGHKSAQFVGRKIIIGFITLAALALQLIPLLTTTGIIKTTQIDCSKIKKNSALKNQCHSNAMYYQLMRVLNMLETFITVVVPPVLIVIMNLFIIHGLLKSREHFNGPEASTDLAVDHQVLKFISFHGEK